MSGTLYHHGGFARLHSAELLATGHRWDVASQLWTAFETVDQHSGCGILPVLCALLDATVPLLSCHHWGAALLPSCFS